MKIRLNFTVICVISLMILSQFGYSKEDAPASIPGTTVVNAEQIIELVTKNSSVVLIDSRKTSDRNKGYIEGSIGLQDTDTTADTLAKYVKTKTTPVLFYCNGVKCGRSGKASKIALKAGYKTIYWFRGGWDEWASKGLPVMKD